MKILTAEIIDNNICEVTSFDTVNIRFKNKAVIHETLIRKTATKITDVFLDGNYDLLLVEKAGMGLGLRDQLVGNFDNKGYLYNAEQGTVKEKIVEKKKEMDFTINGLNLFKLDDSDELSKIIGKVWEELTDALVPPSISLKQDLSNIDLNQINKVQAIAEIIKTLTGSGMSVDQAIEFISKNK